MLNKRIVFVRPREVVIEEAEVSEPSSEQVLIQSLVTLVSTGTELTILNGEFPPDSYWAQYGRYPFVAGYSNVGKVLKVGENVKLVKAGDRVFCQGPHAQYVLAEEKDVIQVPESISDEEASFNTLAAGVMNSVRLADVSLGESVVVVGVGLLGQLAIQFSRLCGGFPVIALDLSEGRLEIAKLSGASATLQVGRGNVEDDVRSFTKDRMADVVFEVTGNPKVIPWALRLVKRQGRFIQLSSPRGISEVDFHDEVNAPSRIIIGTHFNSQPAFETPYNPWTRKRNTELFFDLLSAGIVSVKHLITHRCPWHEAPTVYQMLLQDRTQAIGVIFDFR